MSIHSNGANMTHVTQFVKGNVKKMSLVGNLTENAEMGDFKKRLLIQRLFKSKSVFKSVFSSFLLQLAGW